MHFNTSLGEFSSVGRIQFLLIRVDFLSFSHLSVCTLLLLIFAGLNFRDFRDFLKIAKLKTCEN